MRGQTGIIFGLSSVSGSLAVFNCSDIRYMCLWMESGLCVLNENGGEDRGRESQTGRAKLGVITDSPNGALD